MSSNPHSSFYFFDSSSLSVVAGGASALDSPFLHIHNLEEAESFLKSYGYQINNPDDLTRLWYFHRRALVLMTEKLNVDPAEIPIVIREKEELKDIRQLLIFASQRDQPHIQKMGVRLFKMYARFCSCRNRFI